MTHEERELAQRTQLAMDLWPTVGEASGCDNCGALFRKPDDHGRCPSCASASVFNAAAAMNAERPTYAERFARPTYAERFAVAQRLIQKIEDALKETTDGPV